MEIECRSELSEKEKESDMRSGTNNIEEQIVEDAEPEPEDDESLPSGGLNAWLYVFPTFIMFISAW